MPSVSINGDRISEQEHEYYHILGGKSVTDRLLEDGEIPDLGEAMKDRNQHNVGTATDCVMMRASLKEKELLARWPALPWHIGGRVQKWVITSEAATEEENNIPTLKVRVKRGDVISENFTQLSPEAYNRYMTDHDDGIKERLEKWDRSVQADDRNPNAKEKFDELTKRAAQPEKSEPEKPAQSGDYNEK